MRRALVVVACMLAFAQSRGQVGCSPFGDLNGDSLVTILDLMSLLGVYGVDYTTQNPGEECQSVTWNGYTYDVVQIGEQCWFAENLRTQLYQNGDSIVNDPELCPNPNGTYCDHGTGWTENCFGCGMTGIVSQPSWWDTEEDFDMESIYGRMYNRASVRDPRKLCPAGWSIPRDTDYQYICSLFGDQNSTLIDDGLVLDGTGGWYWGNGFELPECALDLSGLGLRMGGYTGFSGFPGEAGVGSVGAYWKHIISYSNYEEGDRYMALLRFSYECGTASMSDFPNSGGYIRCIKD